MTEQEKMKPVETTKLFPFEVAKWENEKEYNGKQIKTYSFTLSKSIPPKEKDGDWKSVQMTIFPDELCKGAYALIEAFKKHNIKEKE